jgi:hypothetical protein
MNNDYCDISNIVKRLDEIYIKQKIHISHTTKKCLFCGKIKPYDDFDNGGNTNTNKCYDCRVDRYCNDELKKKLYSELYPIIKSEKKINKIIEKTIMPEHIKLKRILFKIKAKIKENNSLIIKN